MHLVCLDLEGVLAPEIWIAFADATGIPELKKTTRDEPNYDKLMRERLSIIDAHNFKIDDIQRVISTLDPLEGAFEFVESLRKKTQLVILSDTFTQFAKPLMKKLGYPTLFCNDLDIAADGRITGYKLRKKDGKKNAVEAFSSMNVKVMAAGDSYNDLGMIKTADVGVLFCAPENVKLEHPEIRTVSTYSELLAVVDEFLLST